MSESIQSFYQLLSHLHQETDLTILLISHDTEICIKNSGPNILVRKWNNGRKITISYVIEFYDRKKEHLMSIFEYAFMQRAFIVGILSGMTIPCIGTIIVLKRLSMLGDTLSHTSLAGVAGGLIFHINPVVGATITCIGAALGIEAIRKKIPQYAEIAIAIMLSVGVGTAAVLSGFVSNTANFNSFLFGSIVAISDAELYMVITLSIIVLILFYSFL